VAAILVIAVLSANDGDLERSTALVHLLKAATPPRSP
jgi:hypothetical protein